MNLHELFTYDDGLLYKKNTNFIYSSINKDGYNRVVIDKKEYRAHRIIWEMFNGPVPEGMIIDHIDGDKLNNRIENLRVCTHVLNSNNRVFKKTSNLPVGVRKHRGCFEARIRFNNKEIYLGRFKTAEEAGNAYSTKSTELRSSFLFKEQL